MNADVFRKAEALRYHLAAQPVADLQAAHLLEPLRHLLASSLGYSLHARPCERLGVDAAEDALEALQLEDPRHVQLVVFARRLRHTVDGAEPLPMATNSGRVI